MSTNEEVQTACERMQKAQRELLAYAARPRHADSSVHPHLARALEHATQEYIRLVLDLKL